MAPTTPTGPPSQATAGDTWRWKVEDSADYPQSEGWSLKYELVGASTLSVVPVFQTSGDDVDTWLTVLTLADTKGLTPGTYQLIGRMVGSGDYTGREDPYSRHDLQVLQDPRTAYDGEFQTHEERALVVIEAAIEGRLTKDMESYSIGGRSITKIPIRELIGLRAKYRASINSQRYGTIGRPVEVRFG